MIPSKVGADTFLFLRRWVVKNKERFKESNSSLYSRVPNIPGVPNKSVGGNSILKINKTGGDIVNKKFRKWTWRKVNHPKKNKNSYCLIRNSRICTCHLNRNHQNFLHIKCQMRCSNSLWTRRRKDGRKEKLEALRRSERVVHK